MKKNVIALLFILVISLLANAEQSGDYVHYRLGVKYKNTRKYEQAVEEFKKVLAAYPDNYNAYMKLAEIRKDQGRMRLTIFNLKKALDYNPGWSKAQKELASAYFIDGQYQQSIKEYQAYLEYCDPAERDSVQSVIKKVTATMSGAPVEAPKKKDIDTAQSSTVDSLVVNKDNKAPKKDENTILAKKTTAKKVSKSTPKKGSATEADREFRMGVSAYSSAINSGNSKMFDKAISHLRNALKLQPGHSGAYYYAGLIRRRLGQRDMAKVNFEKATGYPELGYNAHFYLGKIYGEEKQYKKAIKHLEQYLPLTDYAPGKREAEALIKKYRAAYKLANQDTIPVVDMKKLSQNEMNREMSSIPEKEEFAPLEIRIDSLLTLSLVDTLTNPGQAMLEGVRSFEDKKMDESIENFKKVLLKYPKGDVAARSLYDIGVCYMKLKNFPKASDKFQQIISKYSGHSLVSNALFLKALALAEMKEDKSAEKLFERFISKYKKHKWIGKAYEQLGDILVDIMQDKRAAEAYKEAAANKKSDIDGVYANYKLGTVYLRLKNIPRALSAFYAAIEIGNKNSIYERVPDSYYKIADTYYKQKNYTKALKEYTTVTRKFKDYQDTPWGLFQIGSIYKNLKKYDLAIKSFNLLIKKYPNDYWARQAKWKLDDTVWEHEYRAVLD